MNLFRIDFIQGKTTAPNIGQVEHSLIDGSTNRAIISLSISPDKLQGISNYSREPKRLVFECFLNDWLRDHILSGDHEHERYISHYEVKAYRDEVLFFTGIIDTSQLSYDVSTEILKLTCYDKIKLLSIYSDLTHYYSLQQGYQPYQILLEFLRDIKRAIPINISASYTTALPVLNNSLNIATVDYADLLAAPGLTPTQTWHIDPTSWSLPKYGYRFGSTLYFLFAHKVIGKVDYGGVTAYYQARIRGRIYRFFNGICPVVDEYDHRSGWVPASELDDIDNTEELMKFFRDHGVPESWLDSLVTGGQHNARDYSSALAENKAIATFSGNVYPSHLQPGTTYENWQYAQTENLKTLQAMMLLYNYTLYSSPSGSILLKPKDGYSDTIIDIAANDVVSLVTKRGNQEQPKIDELDILAGDTTQLKDIVRGQLTDFYGSRWSVDATIDQIAKYNLALQDKIRIQDTVYAITELDRDYINDEYKVKAWRI